jgi:putative ATP-binding cassette transporter
LLSRFWQSASGFWKGRSAWRAWPLVVLLVATVLCTPKYLAGARSLGEVVQAAAASVVVTSAFNWFTDNYARLAEWASSANRVASLLIGLDQIDRMRADLKGSAE